MKVEYHPQSISDLNSAREYYNRQRPGLGDEFRSEVYAGIERVSTNPFQYAIVERNIRRCLVHRFPYAVLFRQVDGSTILILTVRHQRRHPRFGMGRS